MSDEDIIIYDGTKVPYKVNGSHWSTFTIVINPNKVFFEPTDPGYGAMWAKLEAFGKWYLRRQNFEKSLVFTDTDNIVRTRKEHLDKIIKYHEKFGSIEIGDINHRLHLNLYIEIEHTTSMQIDRKWMYKYASAIIGIPQKHIRVNIQGGGMPPEKYVKKGVKI